MLLSYQVIFLINELWNICIDYMKIILFVKIKKIYICVLNNMNVNVQTRDAQFVECGVLVGYTLHV